MVTLAGLSFLGLGVRASIAQYGVLQPVIV